MNSHSLGRHSTLIMVGTCTKTALALVSRIFLGNEWKKHNAQTTQTSLPCIIIYNAALRV